MSIPANRQDASPTFQPFTKAERIRQLNDIDKCITQLLRSAAEAMATLTDSQTPIAERRQVFESKSDSYLKLLQVVDVGLRRQIYGLEEANIIAADKVKKKTKDAQAQITKTAAVTGADAVASDMGKLDIGWLNSRSNQVDRDMEAELWEKSRVFMEKLQKENSGGADLSGDHDMGTS